jgi:multidrug efflux pump subunit AcrB
VDPAPFVSSSSPASSVLAFPLKRRAFALVVFSALLAAGVVTLQSIPKTEDPVFPIPTYPVKVVLPGASPADIERLVVDPLEREIKKIEGLKVMKATAQEGVAVVVPEFNSGLDPDKLADDVRRAVINARLPSDVVLVDVERAQSNNVKTLIVGVTSMTASWDLLEQHTEALQARLERVDGVRDVAIEGLPAAQVRITVDAPRAAAIGVTTVDVASAVERAAREIPGGTVVAGQRQLTVHAAGGVDSLRDIEDAVVTAPSSTAGSALVRVKDVARIEVARAVDGVLVRIDGQRGVLVSTTVQQGRDVLAVQDRIYAAVDELTTLAAADDVHFTTTFDQAQNIEHRLAGFLRDFVIAIILVLFTLLPLGPRASIVVMVSVPLSLATGVLVLSAFGFTINQLSIVGFVIALGLLVDDSIVVIENIARAIRNGLSASSAALAATQQIAPSVLGCTATLLFSFLPLMLLPGATGDFIRSLPVAVVATISASLLVSLMLVPLLSALLLKDEPDHDGNIVLRGLNRVVEATFRPLLGWALRRPLLTVLAGALLVLSSFALVPSIGFSLFPKADIPQLLVSVEMPAGASLSATDAVVKDVETLLRKNEHVSHVVATVGIGMPQTYYNLQPFQRRASVAELLVLLDHFDPEHTPALLDEWRAQLDALPGRVSLLEMQQGPPVDAPIAIRVQGDNLEQLVLASAQVARVMKATAGARDVVDPGTERLPDLDLTLDEDRLAAFGIPVVVADQAVRVAVAGQTAGRFFDDADDDPRAIVVGQRRSIDGYDTAPAAVLHEVWLPSPKGPVPLSAVAQPRLRASPDRIRHHNDVRTITVTSQVSTGSNTDRVTNAILAALAKETLPKGTSYVAGGEIESRKESFGGIGIAIVIALFGVLSVLVLEFGSLRGTIVVAAVIPFGIAGGLVALWLSGYTLSFTAMVGFVALVGIEVKNSILLVDFTDELRQRGMGLDDAIAKAGEVRFIPILLTTATALGGLVPLALEQSSMFSPLAIVISGGLLSSTFLARLVTPVVYKLLAPPLDQDLVTDLGGTAVAVEASSIAVSGERFDGGAL